MRSGGGSSSSTSGGLQQSLTAEAASVLKQSVGLARRRGHAQVTPLHVAATLLSLRSSSLRNACLTLTSHTNNTNLQYYSRALDLCFNVALNRLPTSPSLLHPPSLSNALIAALKRAHAHHRRPPPPLLTTSLTVKVELQQLILSILDDPSVSRVMREAGFSSSTVKSNLHSPNNSSSSSSLLFSPYHYPSSSSVLDLDSKTSVFHDKEKEKEEEEEEHDKVISWCDECASNYEKEAQMFKPAHNKLLPSWLHPHTPQAHHKDELSQLRRKWKRLCHAVHQRKHSQDHLYSNNHSSNANMNPFGWPNQGSSTSNSMTPDSIRPSYNSNYLVPRFRRQQSCTIEFNFCNNETQRLDSLIKDSTEGKEVKISLALGNSSFGDSGQTVENITERRAHICKLLQENVPWQSQTLLSSIAEVVSFDPKSAKQNCVWLLMQGNDIIGKRRLARAIAEAVCGSARLLFNLDMKKTETLADPRCEKLTKALRTHEQLVVLIENADFADTQFMKLIAGGFETEKFGAFSTTEEKAGQAIFILTNNSEEQNQDHDDVVFNLVLKVMSEENETKPSMNHKRKAERDLLTKFKSPRMEQKDEVFKKPLDLNLNIRAEEEDDIDGGGISSSMMNGFLDSIENRFVLDRKKKVEMGELFMRKMRTCFGEVLGKQKLENFRIEERVIEEMSEGCGCFTNSLFERWVKEIFERRLQGIKLGGKEEGIVLKLCWGGKDKGKEGKGDRVLIMDSNSIKGFMSSCLPTNIQLNYSMD